MRLTALPAFDDNYIWTLEDDTQRALIVDPGQAAPVLKAASAGMQPAAILLTHHHGDHIGGVAELLETWPQLPVYAPEDERITLDCERVSGGQQVNLAGFSLDVLAVPGHTTSHVAFFGHGHLFCGDALFSLGCGRMFEGTAAQMLASLKRLATLPAQTLLCCGHEYTVANAVFARHVDPTNAALQRRQQEAMDMRSRHLPTLPTTLGAELQCNPFLRTQAPAVIAAAQTWAGRALAEEVDVFAALRQWKDGFRA